MAEIGVGLIGFGLAGRYLHAPVIPSAGGFRIASVTTSRTDEVRAVLPEAQVAESAEALLADPAVELVVIVTPNPTHAALAQAALAAGKHVVVDKPMALGLAEADALIAAAAGAGRVLSVYHNRRWDGDFLTVRRLAEQRTLGDIMLAELCWDRFRPAIKQGWREDAAPGSGVLADLGPHLIDQALVLFGKPEAVEADVIAQREAARVDDYFALTLHYGRRRVRLSAATLVADPRPRFALHGRDASFVKHGVDPQEAVLRAGGSPEAPGYGIEGAEAYGRLIRPDGSSEAVPSERGDWRHFYAGMRAAIRDGAPPPVDPADARAGLAIIAAARASAEQGRRLPL